MYAVVTSAQPLRPAPSPVAISSRPATGRLAGPVRRSADAGRHASHRARVTRAQYRRRRLVVLALVSALVGVGALIPAAPSVAERAVAVAVAVLWVVSVVGLLRWSRPDGRHPAASPAHR